MDCANHPGVEGPHLCAECGKYFCPECVVRMRGRLYCGTCKEIVIGIPEEKRRTGGIWLLVGCGFLLFLTVSCLIGLVFIPGYVGPSRVVGNEAAAIGALRTISTAQTLFREADKDGNNTPDYAENLVALETEALIDSVLGSGTKQGYIFSIVRSTTDPTAKWSCTADPESPGETGNRYFFVDESGIIRFDSVGPAGPSSRPVGR